jgi:hypothetical protein
MESDILKACQEYRAWNNGQKPTIFIAKKTIKDLLEKINFYESLNENIMELSGYPMTIDKNIEYGWYIK